MSGNGEVLHATGVMPARESDTKLDAHHESAVAILVIANPKFSARGDFWERFEGGRISDFTGDLRLGEVGTGESHLIKIGCVEQHFHSFKSWQSMGWSRRNHNPGES
jgi:hypothetical protein